MCIFYLVTQRWLHIAIAKTHNWLKELAQLFVTLLLQIPFIFEEPSLTESTYEDLEPIAEYRQRTTTKPATKQHASGPSRSFQVPQ